MWLIRAAVALVFIYIGASKFEVDSSWTRIFDRIGLGQWFRYFTGSLQVLGGVLVLIPRMFAYGILILAVTMIGAMATWVFLLGAPLNAVVPGAILAALLFVGGDDLIEIPSELRNAWRPRRR